MISSVKMELNETKEEIRDNRHIALFKHIVTGDNVDTTIFLIHGSMATYRQFEEIIQYFKDKFPVNLIAYDAYGCGRSDRPRDWVHI